jgi:nitroreductase
MKTIILGICFFTTVFVSAQNTKNGMTPMANTCPNQTSQAKDDNIWNTFQNRRSVRKFKPDSIPHSDILRIIDAARMAPTSGNQQPWKFLIIQDSNKIKQIKEACIKEALDRYDNQKDHNETKEKMAEKARKAYDGYCSAPVFIVVLTDNNSVYPGYNHWDGPLAGGYLMLAARALGYGTVFITDAIPEKVTKEVLNIPDNYTRVCITPLGIPYEWPQKPTKKDLKEFMTWETF